jgi:hypothetical protein
MIRAPFRLPEESALFGQFLAPTEEKYERAKREWRFMGARYLRAYRSDTVSVLQRWEGLVTAVDEASFVARLFDLNTPGIEEEAEFSIEEVSPEDRELLYPGAAFYWTIGYRDRISGQRSRVSEIRMRRLRTTSRSEHEAAKERARGLEHEIGW